MWFVDRRNNVNVALVQEKAEMTQQPRDDKTGHYQSNSAIKQLTSDVVKDAIARQVRVAIDTAIQKSRERGYFSPIHVDKIIQDLAPDHDVESVRKLVEQSLVNSPVPIQAQIILTPATNGET